MASKQIWIKADPWDKKLVTSALEAGADGVWVAQGFPAKVRELGLIRTIAPDGDLKLGADVALIEINSKADEHKAAKISSKSIAVIKAGDWSIIPLENLIAQGGKIYAAVDTLDEVKTALGILEKGVDGVLFSPSNPADIARAVALVHGAEAGVELATASITEIKPLGMGDRVCIDTCTSMSQGQGTLVGNTSGFLFLIHAETVENPYVEPRPFRVNAGGVHAYVMVPGGKTKYLSELKIGDEVLVAGHDGKAEPAVIGRTKTERRPMLLVTAKVNGREASVILQNAETIRLTSPDGNPISVVNLKPGDKVLVHVESKARHFGMAIDETIKEK